ncbi:Gn_AT_II domain containing protein [uncultured Caudovirales phage]|uniref:Gn_AT_II domain containing protein n=1 Tax=uncultured Caudovirales phage TaxID=2100421 RepID=A0A6J5PA58_9CAUD|nr:Gn_AT_II domain containing protein [uncultured Caudovirales phage]CAB4170729.1 Gn_AT_II domain containing protein [uncultured Caudovirales phage]CAB4177054.1 Gn_AT_II domain containing protein [uncultured Caudovirales phage]CAB4223164.1 Gn_AT_II domain containing protein [uncultured Caudovirales phage]
MCAIIGAILKDPRKEDFEMLRRVFIESRIRGMHATGISFLPKWSDKVVTIKEAVPADKFIETHMHIDNMKEMLNADNNLYLIGHCRYSTSDLSYNQPIANDKVSIVHNGVITQENPSNWKELYGYDTETLNDSELILKTLEAEHELSALQPLEKWPESSIAVAELRNNKTIRCYRNGKRPLYLTLNQRYGIITSTVDIARRSNIVTEDSNLLEINMNQYVVLNSDLRMHIKQIDSDLPDLQRVKYNAI